METPFVRNLARHRLTSAQMAYYSLQDSGIIPASLFVRVSQLFNVGLSHEN